MNICLFRIISPFCIFHMRHALILNTNKETVWNWIFSTDFPEKSRKKQVCNGSVFFFFFFFFFLGGGVLLMITCTPMNTFVQVLALISIMFHFFSYCGIIRWLHYIEIKVSFQVGFCRPLWPYFDLWSGISQKFHINVIWALILCWNKSPFSIFWGTVWLYCMHKEENLVFAHPRDLIWPLTGHISYMPYVCNIFILNL